MFIKKRYIIITLTLVVLLLIPTVVSAAESYIKTIDVHVNTVNVAVNNKLVSVDNFLYEGTTYIPLRAVSEALGADVGWDEETSTASIDLSGSIHSLEYYNMLYVLRLIKETTEMYRNVSKEIELTLYVALLNKYDVTYNNYELAYKGLNIAIDMYNDNLKFETYDPFPLPEGVFSSAFNCWRFYIEESHAFLTKAMSGINKLLSDNHFNVSKHADNLALCLEYNNNAELLLQSADVVELYNFDAVIKAVVSDLDYEDYNGYIDYTLQNTNDYVELFDIYNTYQNNRTEKVKIILPPYNSSLESPSSSVIDYFPIIINESQKPIAEPTNEYVFPLHLYSNDGKVYLGKCVTDEKDKDGIYYWSFGDYSSAYSQTSIWNNVGKHREHDR